MIKPDKFQTMAAKIMADVADKQRPLEANPTRKRISEYVHKRMESYTLEEVAYALRALAQATEYGTITPDLARLDTRQAVEDMIRYRELPSFLNGKYGLTAENYADIRARLIGMADAPDRTEDRRLFLLQVKAMEVIGSVPGYFPTPDLAAELLVSKLYLRPGMTVLEPSAGDGQLVRAVLACEPEAKVLCVERSYSLFDLLQAYGYEAQCNNFLDLNRYSLPHIDAVVMNPPFEGGADARHFLKALEFLQDEGGEIAAIVSQGLMYRSDKLARYFREVITGLGAEMENLPAGTFKTSGTMTASVMIHAHVNKGARW